MFCLGVIGLQCQPQTGLSLIAETQSYRPSVSPPSYQPPAQHNYTTTLRYTADYTYTYFKMVCSKCQKLTKSTSLATPGVKKKNEMYYGSPASSSSKTGDKTKTSATLGNNGVGKVCPCLKAQCNWLSDTDIESRVNSYPKPPETHTQHTQAHAPLARRRLIKEGHTARNAHTKQMVWF